MSLSVTITSGIYRKPFSNLLTCVQAAQAAAKAPVSNGHWHAARGHGSIRGKDKTVISRNETRDHGCRPRIRAAMGNGGGCLPPTSAFGLLASRGEISPLRKSLSPRNQIRLATMHRRLVSEVTQIVAGRPENAVAFASTSSAVGLLHPNRCQWSVSG